MAMVQGPEAYVVAVAPRTQNGLERFIQRLAIARGRGHRLHAEELRPRYYSFPREEIQGVYGSRSRRGRLTNIEAENIYATYHTLADQIQQDLPPDRSPVLHHAKKGKDMISGVQVWRLYYGRPWWRPFWGSEVRKFTSLMGDVTPRALFFKHRMQRIANRNNTGIPPAILPESLRGKLIKEQAIKSVRELANNNINVNNSSFINRIQDKFDTAKQLLRPHWFQILFDKIGPRRFFQSVIPILAFENEASRAIAREDIEHVAATGHNPRVKISGAIFWGILEGIADHFEGNLQQKQKRRFFGDLLYFGTHLVIDDGIAKVIESRHYAEDPFFGNELSRDAVNHALQIVNAVTGVSRKFRIFRLAPILRHLQLGGERQIRNRLNAVPFEGLAYEDQQFIVKVAALVAMRDIKDQQGINSTLKPAKSRDYLKMLHTAFKNRNTP